MRFSWLAALCLLLTPPVLAEPYTVEDLLRLESYGQIVLDPTGHWAVVERRDRYDSAPSYKYDWFTRRLLSKLLVVDLDARSAARPLFEQAKDAGYWSAGFSPSGRRLTIVRLAKDKISIGIVDMASRKVRWLPLVPDLPDAHPAPIWVDDDRVILVTLDDGGLPALFQTPTHAQAASIRGWQRAESGQIASSTLLGSGRYLDMGIGYRARRIIEMNVATGSRRTLFQGDVLDIALSADKRQLAVLTKGPPVQPDPKLPIDPAFEPRRQRLAIVDLTTGKSRRPCPGYDVLPSLLHWAPDGAQLLFFARADSTDWSAGRLYRMDAATGAVRAALPTGLQPATLVVGGSARLVRAGWAGRRVLVYAERASDRRRDWYMIDPAGGAHALTTSLATAPPELAATDASHYFVADRTGLWRGDWQGRLNKVVEGPVTSDRPTLLDGHSVGTRDWVNAIPSRLFAVAGAGADARAVTERGDGRLDIQQLAAGARVLATSATGMLVVFGEDAHGVGSLVLIDRDTRAVVDRINHHLAAVDLPRRILLHTKAADGSVLNHWLTLPSHPAAALPRLVVVPYPGFPYGSGPPGDSGPSTPSVMTHPLLLAGQGYAVLQPSIPLSETPGDPLRVITTELVEAVDAAQASGLVSVAKPFLLGHSYGGYTVLGTASVSDRFAAVVAAAGVYDLASLYASADPRYDYAANGISLTIPIGWSEGGQGRMGVPPWAAVERYARNSAFYHVEDINIPVLLITGDLDYVPVGQAERMFLALYREGKDAMLLRYRGESHGLTSPANVRDYWEHIFAFLRANQEEAPKPQ